MVNKSRKGFTLIEMILVIAIIVILSSVLFFAVSHYMENANTAKARVSSHNSVVDSQGAFVMAAIDEENS